jgi:hypothetical protein
MVPVLNAGTKRSSGMVYRHIPAHFDHRVKILKEVNADFKMATLPDYDFIAIGFNRLAVS